MKWHVTPKGILYWAEKDVCELEDEDEKV